MRMRSHADLQRQPSQMMARFVSGLLLALGLWLVSASASWAATDSHSLAESRVTAFLLEQTAGLGRDIEVTVHPASARLPDCIDPQPFLTNPGQRLYGRVSVGLRCGEQGQQTRYLQASVSVIVDHVVVARDIDAGSLITAGDLMLEEARLERLPRHALLGIDDALGMTAARPLRAGTTLQTHYLRRPELVSRGAHVTVTAHGAGFSISRKAKALDSGALGDAVRLSTDNGEQLVATVTGPDQLKITL
ncbi:flagella basal body P-ring formation protein FlgA [Modicisalibacter xianhensis]|uniref:Flagella basal body P-ring formation protein FlgA n=1 Tax=Modicisalibacter xianhensis TaxID=442341 RepID=A0A4R8FVT1_9GAMM|nr:flagellar basal body P-ring formation chaperone FlgA [Halomonas xianhensis]TDX30962.1 flagella basal body P-ring formation protein FlgA [Halomonas xianhensis]